MSHFNSTRRAMLKMCTLAAAALPIAALAAKNDATRKAMKYQESPSGDKKCSSCLQFVAGKSPTDLGGCKLFAGDTEISPNGYCIAWAKKA